MTALNSTARGDLPLAGVAKRLLAWFGRAQRPLPWRRTYHPYAVWIAEVMLQQTQVETVLPYYRRWMRRFPDVHAVARARPQQVLKLWEGLGYYARGRNLHRAAQEMVKRFGGQVPARLDELLSLPGIGPYTAGAIASIAFNHQVPAIDGNVVRVLSRLMALPAAPAGPQGVRAAAEGLLRHAVGQGGTPRALNQALMELGALVCRPKAPQCPTCPLREPCRARQQGRPERFPLRAARPVRPVRHGVMLLAQMRGRSAIRLLLRRRPPHGLWGGLWEVPWMEREAREPSSQALARLRRQLGLPAGARARPAGTLTHGLTHFRLELECFEVTLAPTAARGVNRARHGETVHDETVHGATLCWATPAQQAALPLARLSRKALQLAGNSA